MDVPARPEGIVIDLLTYSFQLPIISGSMEEFVVVSVKPDKDIAFANDPRDKDDGIVLYPERRQVPVYDDKLDSGLFANARLLGQPLPKLGDRIVCIPEYRGRNARRYGVVWTTINLWERATIEYAVIRENAGSQDADTLWEGVGVLELSVLYPSSLWDNDGIIWAEGDDCIRIVEVIYEDDSDDEGHDIVPANDPRVPLHMLLSDYHGLSLLP